VNSLAVTSGATTVDYSLWAASANWEEDFCQKPPRVPGGRLRKAIGLVALWTATSTALERDPFAWDRSDTTMTVASQRAEQPLGKPLTLRETRTLALSMLQQAEERRLQWARQEADRLAIWEAEP
jgi:hypothetical protein